MTATKKEFSSKEIQKQLGFNARTIGVNKYGLHEVVYGSYETAEEALQVLRDVRKNYNQDAWLLVKELDVVVE